MYGVEAIVAPASESMDDMPFNMESPLLKTGRVQPGESVVFVAGQPVNQPGSTNMLKLHMVSAHE